ncbi:g11618 [Coccomyxa elongata]
MSEKANRRPTLLEQAAVAEKHLVLRCFKEAEICSLELLRNAAYVPGSTLELQRAAFVFVQALYEQGRYTEVLQVLEEQYGGLERIDFGVMLLWVALAVDAKMTLEAASILDKYMHVVHDSDSLELSTEQCAVAARMYAVELLGREAGMYSEAESWVRSNALLTVDQQSTILVELDHVQKSSQASASVEPTERPLWNTNSDAQNAPAAAQSQTLESSSARHTRVQASEHGSGAALRSHATTSGSAAVQALSEANADSRAGTSTSGTEQGPGQFGWYGNLSSSLSNWWQQGEGFAGLSSPQVAGVAAGGVVVLYAVMAERRALLTGLRRVAGGLLGGVSEVARVALQLNPNPVAAAMAGRQYR